LLRALGVHEFLAKPGLIGELVTAIRRASLSRSAASEAPREPVSERDLEQLETWAQRLMAAGLFAGRSDRGGRSAASSMAGSLDERSAESPELERALAVVRLVLEVRRLRGVILDLARSYACERR
jgi:hypothetical protein